MEVIVIRGKVDDGNQIYGPGEVISGLSPKDAEDLVEGGYCSWHIDGTTTEQSEVDDSSSGGEDGTPPPDGGEVEGEGDDGDDAEGGPDTSVTVAEETPKRRNR